MQHTHIFHDGAEFSERSGEKDTTGNREERVRLKQK